MEERRDACLRSEMGIGQCHGKLMWWAVAPTSSPVPTTAINQWSLPHSLAMKAPRHSMFDAINSGGFNAATADNFQCWKKKILVKRLKQGVSKDQKLTSESILGKEEDPQRALEPAKGRALNSPNNQVGLRHNVTLLVGVCCSERI